MIKHVVTDQLKVIKVYFNVRGNYHIWAKTMVQSFLRKNFPKTPVSVFSVFHYLHCPSKLEMDFG